MHRDLSLPNGHYPLLAYPKLDDRVNSNDEAKLNRPLTLRHSWYKAVAHNYTNEEAVQLKLHQVRLREFQMMMRHKIDHALLLKDYLVPLQAKLDFLLDSSSSFKFDGTNAREHQCEGMFQEPSRLWGTTIVRECNKLCYLTPEAKREMLVIEGQISKVIALQRELIRDVETFEREGELAMTTGSFSKRCSHPMSKVSEHVPGLVIG